MSKPEDILDRFRVSARNNHANGTVGNRNVGGAFRRPLFRVDVITQTYSGDANAGSVIRWK